MDDVAKIERDAACEGCGASTSRGIEQDAITAWNTRQPTQSNLHKTQSAAEQSFAENANKSTGQERQPTQSDALRDQLLQECLVKLRDVQGTEAPKQYACNLIKRIERVLQEPSK
jgi:hypothetical protein